MPETILSPLQIKLFGREVDDLTLTVPSDGCTDPNSVENPEASGRSSKKKSKATESPSKEKSGSSPAYDQLTNQLLRKDAKLARIYGFSYCGRYTVLPEPSIFLVHGTGRDIEEGFHGLLDKSGVAERDWVFENDIKYWEYDRINYSLRCDITSGTLEELLAQVCGDYGEDDAGANPDIASRSHLSSRSHLNARSHINARSHLNARHRVR